MTVVDVLARALACGVVSAVVMLAATRIVVWWINKHDEPV